MLGKFGASAAWSLLVVYVGEIFPTGVRSALNGMVFQVGR